MSTFIKIITWACLILTALALIGAGTLLMELREGADQASGLAFMFVTTWLGILGVLSLVLGAVGFIKARRARIPSPLVYTLSLTIGALALLTGIYYGTYL